MQPFHSCQPRIAALIFLSVFAWTLSSNAQITATWQPLPTDSSWQGPPIGQPTIVSGNTVIVQDRNARTLESFSGPLTIDADVILNTRTIDDECAFTLAFIPVGLGTDEPIHNATWFHFLARNFGTDAIGIDQGSGVATTNVWPETSFPLVVGQTNHLTFTVAADHTLSLAVNGNSYALPGTATMDLSQYQLQIQGWGNIWTVSNITLVPEPTTLVLVSVSVLGLATVVRRRKQR
jgi:hypothetical protein